MFDFPSSPTDGTIYAPPTGPQYQYSGGAWRVASSSVPIATAEARNRIVNGAMQITQENVRGTNLTTSGLYAADQWLTGFTSDGTINGFASVMATYLGTDTGPFAYTLVIGTADAAMAAGQYLQILQAIEGVRAYDFNWGTASALPVVLRFKATCSVALTFAVAIRNFANNRSYVKNCTIAANTPTWFTIAVPGDVTGTWPTDTAGAISVVFGLAAGTTYQAPAESVWSAGNYFATAATGNLWATTGARFSFGAVGLYLDPLATGIAPPWTMPDEAQELSACRRYYDRVPFVVTTASIYWSARWLATKRTTPAITATFDGGSGATFQPLTGPSAEGFYQNTAHNSIATATVIGNSRM